jgi:PAS domain S-box-containing protein
MSNTSQEEQVGGGHNDGFRAIVHPGERTRVEEQLIRSERLLAEAQRLAHIGSWNWDLASHAVTWSDELYRIFGVQPLEFDPGQHGMTFVHPDDKDAIATAVRRTLETKQSFSFFYRIRRRDGEERTLQTNGYLVTNDLGEPVSVFGTTQDVTARKQAEEALERSELLLRLVLDALPVGVAVVDPSGNVLLSNPASSRLWAGMIASGVERYARSKGWWHETGKAIAPDEWASARALANGESSINEVIDIETYDGVRKVIHNSAVPIRDERQAIVGAVVINEDVSAQKAAERELEDSVTQMQALATRLMHAQDDERRRIAQMLHETTAQDLAALKMLLARLGRTSDALSDSDHYVLRESVEIAERSMSAVRTLSYLLHPPFLEENGLISAVRWYAEGYAERSGIEVDLDLPPTFARLPQNLEMALFRVVQEALINIHRHAQSPTAWIRLRSANDSLTLEIRDRGVGMPPELIARLMAGAGVGVGFAGMRERLKQVAGTLEIESKGDGTIVRALVPLSSDPS